MSIFFVKIAEAIQLLRINIIARLAAIIETGTTNGS